VDIYRLEAAQMADAGGDARWDCARGHAWDAQSSVAQNVRCMNCAAQRRELHAARLHTLAEARGGLLLSAAYLDAGTPLRWQCAFGHVWESRADAVGWRRCGQRSSDGVYNEASPRRPDRRI
jgi:hypothetical protein